MFLSKQEFVMVNNDDYNSMSDPTNGNGLSDGLKNILYSSISFLKQSYNYLSPNPKSF